MPVAVVTGCSGFVGAELCKQLIERGFTVRGTVRSINSARSKELVTALKATDSQLSLFQADLLTPGSFDAILEGADYLFHVASPFAIIVDDQQRDVSDGYPFHQRISIGTLPPCVSCAPMHAGVNVPRAHPSRA